MSTVRLGNDLREQRLKAGVIAHLALFAGLPAQVSAAVASRAWTLRGFRAAPIVQRKTHLPGTFAIAYGTVKLVLRSPDGDERVLRLVSAGQTFGEASALLGRAVDYDALALGDCKLVVLPTATLLELADHDARFARNVMLVLARRNTELVAELQAATLQRGAQRLAAYLDSLAGDGAGPTRVALPLSKTLIASRLGVKKETLSRLLRQLSAQGVIEVGHREIAILDRERLTAVVGI